VSDKLEIILLDKCFLFEVLLSMAMGFANLSDAMEMMILSILAPALHCHWQITKVEQATITTVVFLGNNK
jgi:hypothetical protein